MTALWWLAGRITAFAALEATGAHLQLHSYVPAFMPVVLWIIVHYATSCRALSRSTLSTVYTFWRPVELRMDSICPVSTSQ